LAVVAPAGTSADGLRALSEQLKAVPAPKKGKREGGDMAIVPSSSRGGSGDDEDGDDDEE
jgi:hypothetical protein